MTLSVLILFLSLASIGGAYLWKQYLVKQQQDYKNQLIQSEQQFNIDLIRQMKAESTKINLAKQILANHIAVSKIFGLLSSLTAENVRFLTLDFLTPTEANANGGYQMSLTGYGKDLTTVAFQAKVLNKMTDYGLRDVVRNPIVSNPSFNENGSISFNLTATVDPQILQYTAAGANASSSPSGTNQ